MPDPLYQDRLWKILKEEAALPDGRVKVVNRVHGHDSVHILAFPKPGYVLLLREFRPFYGEWHWMLPSGKVDKEKDVLVAAQRELQEETGYRAKVLKPYFSTRNSEGIVQMNHVFIAEELESAPLQQDEHELIEVHEVPLAEAVKGVMENRYGKHTPTAYALLRFGAEHGVL